MSSNFYDIIVVGLGGAGSATLYNLAKSGYKVLGIEKYELLHKNGSTNGESRLTRKSYKEGVEYVPFLEESYKLWSEIEKESEMKLFNEVGCLHIGKNDYDIIQGCIKSAQMYGLPYKMLSSEEINEKYPLFDIPKEFMGFYEECGGILYPEKCISAYLKLIKRYKNASIISNNEGVKKIKKNQGFYEVITRDETYLAKKVVLSVGVFLNDLLKESFNNTLPIVIEKIFVTFFKYKDNRNFGDKQIPVFIGRLGDDKIMDTFYGFPDIGNGYKIGLWEGKTYKELKDVDRTITVKENEDAFKLFSKTFKDFSKLEIVNQESGVCAVTPDEHFIIDYLDNDEDLIIVSACSGHGFKFASWIGKYVTEMFKEKKFIEFFSLKRLKRDGGKF